MTFKQQLSLKINGQRREAWVHAHELLLDVLHDQLGVTDVRYGCGEGVCGTCTVLMDGHPVSACLMFAVQAEDRDLLTGAGLTQPDGALHPLQEAFLRHGAAQCGFCTPGVMLTALSLVERVGSPSRDAIRYELVGNLCRCTGYSKILDAIEDYAIRRGQTPRGDPK
jgi:carbon-monoxide dehydrogenase small subunit